MLKIVFIFLFAAAVYTTAHAHNENIPGPHGGRTQMPANFHTEVVSDKDESFHIYLLDVEFKNPVTENSSIEAYVKNGNKKTTLKCIVMNKDHFHCANKKSIKTGFLVLKTKRSGTEASMDAKYELPLKPFDTQPTAVPLESEDHSKHH